MAIQVFGQGAVQSAYPSYLALDITANSLTLVWADSYVDVPYTDPSTGIHYQALAATMDVTTGADNTNTITLPNATQTSIGQTFIIGNVGLSNFSLNMSNNALLQVVATGIRYWITLTDNSTTTGIWTVITLGAGESQASAAALAGNGLVALVDKLNTNVAVILTAVVPVIDATYRAKLIVWTGGSSTLPLPTIGSVPAGYYLSFSNLGQGQIIIQPGEPGTRISGQTSLAVEVQQSLTIISNGTNWYTLGLGQNQFAVDSALSLDVSASEDVTLTNIQASSIIQRYTGALIADITIFFPVDTSNWFIYNNTTGPHTLSVQLVGPLGTSIVIPQDSKGIFYSDGTSMFVSPTALSLIEGTETLPAISFSESPDTGIYNVVNNGMYFTIVGQNVASITFGPGATAGIVEAVAPNNTRLSIASFDTHGDIIYNGLTSITISTAGVATFTNPATVLNGLMPAATAGSIVYYNGTNWVNLPIGSNGQVLTVSGGVPVWA